MYTLQQAYKELGLLFIIVIVAILLFTSLIFAVEQEGEQAQHWSAYDSFWWGLMCITTVGSGGHAPATIFGKVGTGLLGKSI